VAFLHHRARDLFRLPLAATHQWLKRADYKNNVHEEIALPIALPGIREKPQ
jgi:hypothetical protein